MSQPEVNGRGPVWSSNVFGLQESEEAYTSRIRMRQQQQQDVKNELLDQIAVSAPSTGIATYLLLSLLLPAGVNVCVNQTARLRVGAAEEDGR